MQCYNVTVELLIRELATRILKDGFSFEGSEISVLQVLSPLLYSS